MKVNVREIGHSEVDADLVAIGLYEDGSLPAEIADAAGSAAAEGEFKKLSPAFAGERRLVIVGLGKREQADAERLRVAAALVAKQAVQLHAGSLAWLLPASDDDALAAEALVTGTILATYGFDRFKKAPEEPPARLESLTLLAPEAVGEAAETARVYAEASNRARDLQSTPANSLKPEDLAARAEEIAAGSDALSVEVLGPAELAEKKMGGLLAVSQGGPVEPRLIVLRYAGGGSGPTLGLVGKGVTFDTGGISLKPGAGMHEMKYDMSGAAAVLEAVAAIAELGLAVDLVAIVPSTENMPSGTAIKPGDVITQYNGTTVEVNNTDAEGRLILADALAYAVELGAERIVDLATLTGAVVIALGSTYAAVIVERRRARRRGGRGRRAQRRADLAAAPARRVQGADEGHGRRPLQPRQAAQGGDDHRRLLPRGVRRRHPLGPRRHRRHRLGRRSRVHRQGRQRLRRAVARRAGAGAGCLRARVRS